KRILLDVAKEEKTHVGEFQALLLRHDKEQEKELEEGKKEVDELTG
ncbi:MAG: rubrerythrin, partial [Candidatus Bathyarchaeales archaeon]